MRLFDVHTHLQDDRLSSVINEVMSRAEQSGVARIVSCGVHEGDWEPLTRLAGKYKAIIPTYGLHPWFIKTRTPSWLYILEKLIDKTGASVGEIGLDRMVDTFDEEDQIAVFTAQLRLAKKYRAPVSLHCRKAWALMADILEKEGGLPYYGVIHAYSGSAEMVKVYENLGAFISFAGSVTNPKNKRVAAAVTQVSSDRLLIETDSPDILPHGAHGPLNEPAFIRFVLASVAEKRGEPQETIAQMTYENSMLIYGRFRHENPGDASHAF